MKLNSKQKKRFKKKIENKIQYIYREGKPTFLSMMSFESGLSEEDHAKFVMKYIKTILLCEFNEMNLEYGMPINLHIQWNAEKRNFFFSVELEEEEEVILDEVSHSRIQYQNN